MATEPDNNLLSTRDNEHFQAQITAYWNGRSNHYDYHPNHGLRSQREREGWLAILCDLLPPPPADILDVGTGTGFLALLMAELGHRVTGIDLAEDMLDIARSKSTGMAMLHFEIGDASCPQFPTARFDAITNRHLLWTLIDPKRTFVNWHRLLRPGGRVVAIDSINPPAKPAPNHYSDDLAQALPLRYPKSPEPALVMLRSANFVDVRAARLEQLEQLLREIDPESDPPVRHVFIASRAN
jgi:ubiquinone/menaquinone biosynthesis C-methylase UbiE